MSVHGLHHLVLLVPDVPEAEEFYAELFDADVLFREGALDGEPGTLPEGVEWTDALSSGVDPYMSFLGRGEFYLALAGADRDGDAGRLDHVALAVDDEALESIAGRARELGCSVDRNADHQLFVDDRYDVRWELNAQPAPPTQAFEPLDL